MSGSVETLTGKLFGTDGVRGVAGEFLTAELAFALGRAAVAACDTRSPEVFVVRDTRVSGEMLEAALCAGIAASGGQALLGGVLPTPAASSISPDSRVSRITSTRVGARVGELPRALAARASDSARSAVRNSPATPRTPSVPNRRRDKARR